MKIKKSDIEQASKLFGKFDNDKNGLISVAEFKEGVAAKLSDFDEDSAFWGRAWARIDFDKSKHLSFNEFVPLCVNIKELIQKDFIRELFMLYDYNNNGKLSTSYLKKLIVSP